MPSDNRPDDPAQSRRPTSGTFAAPADPANLRVGMALGRYLLTERLGQGAAGIVFKALHRSLNIPVAIKVLRPEESERDRELYTQLSAEARFLAKLDHRNVVRVLDFEDDPKLPYLVMEYVEGRSLSELIRQSGRLQLPRALRIAFQVAEGLGAAWAAGVVHRDVKPANVLLDKDGNPKVADLGQAVVAGDPTAAQAAGTPAYMAPEHFTAPKTADFRCDIYSLGATFYEAVTGQMPYTGKTAREVMFKHVNERPKPPHELVPGLDPKASQVILTMMARLPEERYQSHGELAAALAGLGAGGSKLVATGAVKKLTRSHGDDLIRDGIAAAEAGQASRAAVMFRAAAELAPDNAHAWQWLASVAATPAEAVKALEKAAALLPDDERVEKSLEGARLRAAQTALKAGDRAGAGAYLRAVAADNPRCEQGWLGLASVAQTPAESAQALERVLAINPANEAAKRALATRPPG